MVDMKGLFIVVVSMGTLLFLILTVFVVIGLFLEGPTPESEPFILLVLGGWFLIFLTNLISKISWWE